MGVATFWDVLLPAIRGEHILNKNKPDTTRNTHVVNSLKFSEVRARTKFRTHNIGELDGMSQGLNILK